MTHIKLTEKYYIATDTIATITLTGLYGEPCVELWHKRKDLLPCYFRGEEAAEAWANWKAHAEPPKQ